MDSDPSTLRDPHRERILENQKQEERNGYLSSRPKGIKEMWIEYTSLLQNSYKNTLSFLLSHTKLHIHARTLWFIILSLLLPHSSYPSLSMQTSPEISLKSMGQNSGMRIYLISKNHGSSSMFDVDGGLHWGYPEIILGNRAFSWERGHLCGLRAAGHTYYGIFFSLWLSVFTGCLLICTMID